MFPIIAGDSDTPSGEDIPFNNLAPLTNGTITIPRPDFYDGARPEQLDRRVQGEIRNYIVPLKISSIPALPNFFAEAKGPDGSAASRRCDRSAWSALCSLLRKRWYRGI